MLQYTGHPLVDVGAATVAALRNKVELADLTDADLDAAADYIAAEYVVEPLKSFLNVAFPNSGFTQPAFEKRPERRADYSERVLRLSRKNTEESDERCVFTGRPATSVRFSDTLPPGRAFRQHIPLLTGEGFMNFYPWGDAGLPVSGEALLCIQAFPLGCAKVGGRLLAVHSDNPEVTYDFAAKFLADNRRALTLARQAGSSKMPEANASARTLLVETLLNIERRRREEARQRRPCSVTAYHLTNSGQSNALDPRNPPLQIYHLPLELTEFLASTFNPQYAAEWRAIADRGWQLGTAKRKAKAATAETGEEQPVRRTNVLFEDIFDLPGNAPFFIRRYFLRLPMRTRFPGDPRSSYSLRNEAELVSWKLTELFLRKVMVMDKERVQQIKDLGDRLAEYVERHNDKRFFASFFEHRYDFFRAALIKANLLHTRQGNPPLLMLEPYIAIFEDGNDVVRSDWRLARDLVLIRMVERLYEGGWLRKNPDAVPEVSPEVPQEEGAAL